MPNILSRRALRAGRIGALVLRRAQDALSNVEGRCSQLFRRHHTG
jgi:hypothetical protein